MEVGASRLLYGAASIFMISTLSFSREHVRHFFPARWRFPMISLQTPIRTIILLTMIILLLGITACAEIKLQTLPPPPPTAKLRVFFLPVSDVMPARLWWGTPHKEFAANMTYQVAHFLQTTGIYEIVPARDVNAVLDGQNDEDIYWVRGNWESAKRVGRAVHADYVVVAHRGFASRGVYFFEMLWINLETGKIFESRNTASSFLDTNAKRQEFKNIVNQIYREIFQQAKEDLLSTAILKGRIAEKAGLGQDLPAKTPVREERIPAVKEKEAPDRLPIIAMGPAPEIPKAGASQKPAVKEPAAKKTPVTSSERTGTPVVAVVRPPVAPPSMREPLIKADIVPAGKKPRLVVYDLEASQPMQVVGLILTEALREEIFKIGSFDLINREDLTRAIEELKLQQSGLVQEKDAVQMGRWFAARQSVTGRLGVIGSTMLLQAKRTDIETMGTLAIGSLNAPAGREEELLNGLSSLARQLFPRQINMNPK